MVFATALFFYEKERGNAAMAKSKLEYIWLDGYQPTQSLRSKTKIVDDFSGNGADAPI